MYSARGVPTFVMQFYYWITYLHKIVKWKILAFSAGVVHSSKSEGKFSTENGILRLTTNCEFRNILPSACIEKVEYKSFC